MFNPKIMWDEFLVYTWMENWEYYSREKDDFLQLRYRRRRNE